MPRSAPTGSPRAAALRLLGRRDYTAAELARRLIDRGYEATDVRTVIAQLTADGTIDDRRAALTHTRTAARIKGRGVWRITRELEARGVAPDIIRDATSQVSPDDERRAIERFLAKRRVPLPAPPDVRRRLVQQLLRRGFAPALVRTVLDASDDSDLL